MEDCGSVLPPKPRLCLIKECATVFYLSVYISWLGQNYYRLIYALMQKKVFMKMRPVRWRCSVVFIISLFL
jgi:hypothetical protein